MSRMQFQEGRVYRALSRMGSHYTFPLKIIFFLNGLYLLMARKILVKRDLRVVADRVKVQNFKPEVVYFAGLSLRFLQLAVEASLYFDVPMVVLHMDNWMERESMQIGALGSLWHRGIVKYMRMAAERSLSNTTNSPALAEIVSGLTGYPHESANNCCLPLVKTAPSPPPCNRVPVITYAGAMNPHLQGRSLEIFARAVAELNVEGYRVKLHIYTPWEFAPQANAIRIPRAVYYMGQVSANDLAKVYERSDFLLATTTFRDEELVLFRYSLATKLSEYLCAGRPVISVGSGLWHLHDYVRKHDCGFTICDKGLPVIKEKLRMVLSTSQDERLRIGRNNRLLWESAHDARIMARRTREALGLGVYPE